MDKRNLVVRRADLATYRRTLELNAEEWRGQLTVDDYIARELMVSQDSAMSAGHQCWVLVPEDAPIDIRCATESWLQEVIWCPPGETKVVHRPALMFVSLYVPLEHRGQGYGHMMQQLVYEHLAEDLRWSGADRLDELSFRLIYGYSDIGDDFYRGLAETRSPYEVTWPVSPAFNQVFTTRPILPVDFDRITARDVELMKQEISTPATDRHRFAVLPNTRNFSTRSRIAQYNALRGDRRIPPDIFGAEVIIDEDYGFCLWTFDWEEKILLILRLRAPTRRHLVSLIGAAQREAKKLRLGVVRVWDVDPGLLDLKAGERLSRRVAPLPELCWLGDQDDKVDWMFCEAYANTPDEP